MNAVHIWFAVPGIEHSTWRQYASLGDCSRWPRRASNEAIFGPGEVRPLTARKAKAIAMPA